MACQHQLDGGLADCLDHIEVLLSRYPKDPVDALILQGRTSRVDPLVIVLSNCNGPDA